MAISADLLDAPGRPVTPAELIREVVPDQPVILVGPSATWDAFGVTAWLEARGWSWTHAADAERARWLTSIQKVSLVLVAGDERARVGDRRGDSSGHDGAAGRPRQAGARRRRLPRGRGRRRRRRPDVRGRRSLRPGRRALAPVGPRLGARCPLSRRRWAAGRPLVAGVRPPRPTPAPLAHGVRAPHVPHDAPAAGVAGAHDRAPSVGLASVGRQEHAAHLRQPPPPEARRRPSRASLHRVRAWHWLSLRRERRRDGGRGGDGHGPHRRRAAALQSIEVLATTLAACDTVEECADHLLDALDASGYADAMSVFQVDGGRMRLVATRNMPAEWVASVRDGVPLSPGFASAARVLSGEVVHLGDIRQMSDQFADTAERAASGGYRACLFLPVVSDGQRVGPRRPRAQGAPALRRNRDLLPASRVRGVCAGAAPLLVVVRVASIT